MRLIGCALLLAAVFLVACAAVPPPFLAKLSGWDRFMALVTGMVSGINGVAAWRDRD